MTYADYPDTAKNNAKKALKHKEDNGSLCGTRVGWLRANQIANGEGLSEDTVQRTYSFLSRAETYDQGKYFDEDGGEICGSIMYDAWGGSAMRDWAEAKFKKIEREKESKAMAKFNIDILGEISESVNSYNVVQREISNAKGKELNLVISSGGGSVTEGMAIADLIANYPEETTATGIGLVASIATVVLLSADKVKMTENAFMMIHRPWSYTMGNADELEATAELLDKMEAKLLDIYTASVIKRKGSQDNLENKITEMMAAETWMTAQEALEFGFIDEIVKVGEKNIDLLPLQNSLSKFINVPAALLINNKKKDDMGNSILEKIKSLLNNMDEKEEVTNVVEEEKVMEEEPKNDEVGDAIQMLKDNGYFVLSPEEMESMHSKQKEEMESMYKKSDEQKNSIDEIESVLETLSTELVALRNQVKKGVGLPSGGTTAEKIIETKAKLSPFDSFAGLVKNKISQR
jgi:ATP-dependent Clp endopeptidase proteolytic subunit ClpP